MNTILALYQKHSHHLVNCFDLSVSIVGCIASVCSAPPPADTPTALPHLHALALLPQQKAARLLDIAMNAEGKPAMKGRSEADDSAAVNKERRNAVTTGSKSRRNRARRAPRAPRAPKASTNRKPARDKGVGAPAKKSSGVKNRGRNENGRFAGKDSGGGSGGGGDLGPSDRSTTKLEVEEQAMNGGGHGSEDVVGGEHAAGSRIEFSPSLSSGEPCGNDAAVAGSGLELKTPKHEQRPVVAPEAQGEYMTQSPLAFDLSPDEIGGPELRRTPEKDSSGSSRDSGSRDGSSGGSSRGSVDGAEGSGGGEDRSGFTSGEGTGGDELPPTPAPDASSLEAMPVDDAAVDGLATLLRKLGVGDENVFKPEGRRDLQALLEAAKGAQMRAVDLFFDRVHETRAGEKVRCVHVQIKQRGM